MMQQIQEKLEVADLEGEIDKLDKLLTNWV